MEGRSRLCLNLFQDLIKTKMALISLLFHDSNSFTVYQQTSHGQRWWLTTFSEGDFKNQRKTPFRITRNKVPHAASRPVLVCLFTACSCSTCTSRVPSVRAGCLPAWLAVSRGQNCSHPGLRFSLGRGARSPCPGGKLTRSPPDFKGSRD